MFLQDIIIKTFAQLWRLRNSFDKILLNKHRLPLVLYGYKLILAIHNTMNRL